VLRPFSLLRLLGQAALVVYFLAAAVLLGMRYWVLPNIDQWRDQIAAQISHTVGAKVRLGAIHASWNGLDPHVELADVAISSPQGAQLLHLDKIQATISWRGLVTGDVRFSLVQAKGLSLRVRRDTAGRLWVLGQSLGPDWNTSASADGAAGLGWLLAQPAVVLRDATVQWLDQARGAPALTLRDVSLELTNGGDRHAFRLTAQSPSSLNTRFDLRGVFASTPSDGGAGFSLEHLDGQLYGRVSVSGAKRWATWVDVPRTFTAAHLGLQAWATIQAGRVRHVALSGDARETGWRDGDGNGAGLDAGSVYAAGPVAAFRRVLRAGNRLSARQPATGSSMAKPAATQEPATAQKSATARASVATKEPVAAKASNETKPAPAPAEPDASGLQFRLALHNLTVRDASVFRAPLSFQTIALQGRASGRGGALHVGVGKLAVVNPDMDLRLAGEWRQGGDGPAGIADVHGQFKRVSVGAISRYLPSGMNKEALKWMTNGLLGGVIHDAGVVLRGDMAYFPFGHDPDKGTFHVRGPFSNVVIDYAPAQATGGQPWPRIDDASGRAALDGVDLRIVADTATIHPAEGQSIHLRNVLARIPDLQGRSVLSIQGDTSASAAAYLALVHHSPLGALLGHSLDDAKATGTWQVPLQMTVPLRNVDQATVRGNVHFQDADITLAAWLPPQSHVTGDLFFSENGVDAARVEAQTLGGPMTIRGAITKTGGSLELSGIAQAKALGRFSGLAGMARVTGHLPYHATVGRLSSGGYQFSADSTLSGLALNFPPPLGKAADEQVPLHVSWKRVPGAMALTVDLGRASLVLQHKLKSTGGPFFFRGFVGLNRKTRLLPDGLDVDIFAPNINIDQWRGVYADFADSSGGPPGWKGSLFPPVRRISVESPHIKVAGATLDKAMFTAQPAKAEKGAQAWRIDLSSSQSAGTVFWYRAQGDRPGRISAKFERLALGGGSGKATPARQEDTDAWKVDKKLHVPAISLHVDRFSVYGHALGSLSVEGVNASNGDQWNLNKLHLGDDAFRLSGRGQWRLDGPDRGLSLQTTAKVSNLGKYLDQMGFKQIMQGGKGTITADVSWRDLPWSYRTQGLNGVFDIDLKDGTFNYQDSRTARLLKLLSLQSVSRVAKMEWNPAEAIKNGFPYDSVHGKIKLDAGVLKTDNYRVVGPVGTIALGGSASMNDNTLDLQAVVIPNLDMSGAAVAAGIVINPVVGIGAFLAQWLLRKPLAKSLAVQYGITGSWDEPVISEEPVSADAKDAKNDGAATPGNSNGSPAHDQHKLPESKH
jgi:uncharacterized protein (TIGR02099 family)